MSDPMVRPERIGMVTFEVWGETDSQLVRNAREVLARFGVNHEYRCKIDAVAVMMGDGSVITWRGDVQAWPETAT